MQEISERLAAVQGEIEAAAACAGRSAGEVELVAVSKTHPPATVTEALNAGQMIFGESRVQEARAKAPEVSSRARWHFIGHLQKNKVRHALPLFEVLHSVDSAELAREIDRVAAEVGLHPRILLEVNLAGEATKFGFQPAALRAEMEGLLSLERVSVEGLMTIPPPAPEAEDSRGFFAGLRELRDELEKEFAVRLPSLSMGMSGDFEVAIEEGATLVRVGTAIFGSRKGKTWRPEGGGE